MFRAAASDANNRVVGNALMALYRLGEAGGRGLYEMASRPDPAFRATAVWAMSETGDTRFLPLLAKIVTDPNETIKAAAFRSDPQAARAGECDGKSWRSESSVNPII